MIWLAKLALAIIITAIILIGLCVAGFALYVLYNWVLDKYQGRKRKAMAVPMEIDELMLRRLKKSVATRIEQRSMANRGFTLIELVLVLAILGTLSWVALTTTDRILKAKAQFMAECHYPKPECEAQWRNKTK